MEPTEGFILAESKDPDPWGKAKQKTESTEVPPVNYVFMLPETLELPCYLKQAQACKTHLISFFYSVYWDDIG